MIEYTIHRNTRGQFFCVVLVRYNTRAWELNGHTMVELLGIVDETEIERLMVCEGINNKTSQAGRHDRVIWLPGRLVNYISICLRPANPARLVAMILCIFGILKPYLISGSYVLCMAAGWVVVFI